MPGKIYEQSINQFLEQAMSSSPTPGGSSVAAVAATLAASMVGMVANLTVGKKAYAAHEEKSKEVLRECSRLIDRLKELTRRDMDAFSGYMAAWRLPGNTEEEKRSRLAALQKAAAQAALVPLDICQACLEVMRQSREISAFGNLMALSDAGVGACLALGALRSAMLSVEVNLQDLNDQEFIEQIRGQRSHLLARAGEIHASVLAAIEQRTVKEQK